MIGVFDSGVGGLTTLRELTRLLPEYDYLYLADQRHNPFGNKSQQQITDITERAVTWLWDQGCELVLIACNTASADALRHLQSKYPDKKVLGCLAPACEQALQKSQFGRIGVVATKGTVDSQNYPRQIAQLATELYKPASKRAAKTPQVTQIAAPLLVPLVEENQLHTPETHSLLKKYLLPLKSHNIDICILGCTHYPLLQKEFAAKLPKHCQLISSSAAQAAATVDYLQRHPEIETKLNKKSVRRYFTTDDPVLFHALGNQFVYQNFSAKDVQRVEL